MKIENIRLFLEVVRYGSINKAAENNFLAQQNLSVIIKNMEAELGDKLLKRNNNGISLTENGKQFYKYALDIVQAYDGYLAYAHKNENNIIDIYTTLALSECLSDLQGCKIDDKYYISLHGRGANEIRQMIEQKKEGFYFLAVIGDDIAKMLKNPACTLIAQENRTSVFCHKNSPWVNVEEIDGKKMQSYMSVSLLSCDTFAGSNMLNVNSMSACKKMMQEKGIYCSLPCSLKRILEFDDPQEWVELMENDDVDIAYFLLCDVNSPQKYHDVQKYLVRNIKQKFQVQ